jgi:L-amino acid ligase C-terminal domain 2
VNDLAAEVTAALGRSILPSVIARGAATLRVVAAEDGVVTLQADGSPGAVLRAVEGRAGALAVPGITGLTITIPLGQRVLPLPDGDRYLGFIFAEGDTGPEVEHALTAASERLRVIID